MVGGDINSTAEKARIGTWEWEQFSIMPEFANDSSPQGKQLAKMSFAQSY